MPVQANATFTFTAYEVTDAGIVMAFVCLNPGPGEANDYSVLVTDAELAAVTTAPQFTALVQTKLQRKVRGAGIASKLDARIGQSLTV